MARVIERQDRGNKLSRGIFYPAATRCLTGPSGRVTIRGTQPSARSSPRKVTSQRGSDRPLQVSLRGFCGAKQGSAGSAGLSEGSDPMLIFQKTRDGCPKFLAGKIFRQISTLLENSSPIFRQQKRLSLPRFGHFLARKTAAGKLAVPSGTLLDFLLQDRHSLLEFF